MKVGVIDNFDSFVYNLVRYVREVDGVEVIVQRNNDVDYEELDSCDAILLSPGPGIPSEAGELLNVISRYSGKKKMLGVCLGHQAIAEVFGGTLEQCPQPVHGKASTMQLLKPDSLFNGLPDAMPVGRYHSWKITADNNPLLEVTAQTEDGVVMAFRHTVHDTKGVQFHPESILTPQGRQMIENWIRE
ncbi:aminodeoxychorismate/anthranilate synthase component II [Flavobacterium sp. Sd200]|uniref:anthranilate synthase component II n=1 Tax=Flavobacterium sp. Sd200 TaxID=2692211 RepID=UPI0013683131|nr:aminodeoxychorismate/anthranilate synthase component II [Flavobacterium sp. Sd200]MXN89967.1 aminodeoxychorismate/anthranilate synthase component II [Flavobacterium sp. Sd200]